MHHSVSYSSVHAFHELADRVQAFRESGLRGPAGLSRFLPDQSHVQYRKLVNELVLTDFVTRRLAGETAQIEEYRHYFPELDKSEVHQETVEVAVSPVSKILATASHDSAELPEVGDYFQGFHLVELLGKGAFGSVFLAEQTLLAGRKVALKVTTRIDQEPERLARLRHTNIVPIYSVHIAPPFQAMCMPFLGRYTLAHIVTSLRHSEQLPISGSGLFTTIGDKRGPTQNSSRLLVASDHQPNSQGSVPSEVPPAARDKLARMNYVDAVLWIALRTAEGLHHAHEAGLIHRDLKPANVLLGDDGQPMLLDFNLAVDSADIKNASLGGTVAYMSPEQLAAFQTGDKEKITQRSDLYSLGVILFELLTGRHPFKVLGRGLVMFRAMLEERRATPPSLRDHNPQVSPAVETIVQHLLAPDPQKRYRSAAQVVTDLDRHMRNLPLQYAANSWPERGRKWLRRNPRALPVFGLALTLLAAIGIGVALVRAKNAQRHEEAVNQSRIFPEHLPAIRVDLSSINDAPARADGIRHCRDLLARYAVLTNPKWREESRVQSLDADKKREVIEDVGEALHLLARAEWRQVKIDAPVDARQEAEEIRKLQELAKTCFEANKLPPSFWTLDAELAEAVGDQVAQQSGVENTKSATLTTARDYYLEGTAALWRGQALEAREFLEAAIARKPDHYAAHFSHGYASQLLRDFPRAMTHYRIAADLRVDDYRPYFNRGVILLLQGRHPEAVKEFDKAIAINPGHGESYRHRAVALIGGKHWEKAIEDLDQALTLNASTLVVSLLKAQCLDALQLPERAQKLRTSAAGLQPKEESEFLTRAFSKMAANDPNGALGDLNEALKLNPYSLSGLQNKAHVLAEMLGRLDEALKVMDQVVEKHRDFSEGRAGRAVLLARLGKRDLAHEEIQRALVMGGDATIIYQAACVYSITSGQQAEDLGRAMSFLREALRNNFRDFAVIDTDHDIDALRKHSEFKAVLKAARELYRAVKR
jgi:serine/threonine protein kinase/Tfp pilus assembly protein PilF